MSKATLSATTQGNAYNATISYDDGGVKITSAETYPTIEEAITAAAIKLLNMPERLKRMDQFDLLG